MTFERELQFAKDAAKRAGNLALDYWRTGLVAEDKADDSPVTIADRRCEELVASMIEESFPDDGILGEEGSAKSGSSGRKWIVDPIDGTRDFLRGNRLFANLIALEDGGDIVAGVANFPALDELYHASKGGGAFCNDVRIQVSKITDKRRSVICANSLNKAQEGRLLPFLADAWAVRSIGGAWDAMFVCSGKAELWIEPTAKPWDLAPLRVIAKESGAAYFDLQGNDTIYSGGAIICVPALKSAARSYLGLC